MEFSKTTWFILPFTGMSFDDLKPYFYDSYLGIKELPKYEDCIVIVLYWHGEKKYSLLERLLSERKDFITSLDTNSGKFTIFILCLSEYKDDIAMIFRGKYSRISEQAKKALLRNREPNGRIKQILYPTKEIREAFAKQLSETLGMPVKATSDMEVKSVIVLENELLDLSLLESI